MENLEVQIGARITEFQSKLAQAIKGFDKLKAEEKELSKAYKAGKISADNYYNSIAKNSTKLTQAGSKVSKYKAEINKMQGGMGDATKSIASGNSAMTAFSRTIQDAPFGIMGVSNNITNLTEQFGYLKNKTGSSKDALKSMLKDLKGFGGITLAISVATSLLLVFGDKIFATKDKVKELKKEQEDLSKSLENYALGLEAVNQANLKGAQSSQKEIVTLQLLSSQLNNTNLSLDKRKDAIDTLRKKYPEYLKNMTDEKLLNGGLASVYDTLTGSILKRAKATASMNAIIKNSEMLLSLEGQLLVAKDKATKSEEAYQKKLTTGKTSQRSGVVVGLQQLKNEAKGAQDAFMKLEGQIQRLELTNIDLEQNVTNEGGIADLIVPKNTGEQIRQRVASLGIAETLRGSLAGIQDVLNEQPLKIITDDSLSQFDIDAMLLKDKMLKFSEDINSVIQNNVVGAFAGIGNAIGNAMSGAGSLAQNLGASLLGALGGVLTQLGTMALTIGISLSAIKKALISLNPALAIGAGVALIALGSFFSNKSQSIGSSVGGGGGSSTNAGSSSSSGGSSYSGGSSISSNQGGGTYVFEIQGQKLVGVLKNTLDRNRNLGGTLSII